MQDAFDKDWSYHKYMTRVYAADALTGEYPALRVMLPDLIWKAAGEAVHGATTLAQAHPNILSTGTDVIPRIRPLRLCINSTERETVWPRGSLVLSAIRTPVSRVSGFGRGRVYR
jgi:hypothetical protein